MLAHIRDELSKYVYIEVPQNLPTTIPNGQI